MITRDRVADIVNCRLAEDELVAELRQLSGENISLEILRMFIEETRPTAAGKDKLPPGAGLLDVSGTGGSGISHFNTSTFCAFVLAAGGVKVAKFGNRASRSGTGSADLLEALGIPLDLPAERVADVIERAGVAFLFAPHYYPGLKRLAAARKAVGQPTIFNHIGPLLNPVNPEYRLMGMASDHIYPIVVDYLRDAKAGRTLLVRAAVGACEQGLAGRGVSGLGVNEPGVNEPSVGEPGVGELGVDELGVDELGVDELLPGSSNAVVHIRDGFVEDLSFSAQGISPFSGGNGKPRNFDLQHNIDVFNELITAQSSNEAQPWVDLVSLNAGAGFFVAGTADSIINGVSLAKELISSGCVKEKFDEVRRVYEKCAA